ncbi:MAG: hypothetical protein KAQ67_07410, partial [Gammaproteobacteria bacterium]|nr:hypothetical protein [Gammaproteobacteria bacterium]
MACEETPETTVQDAALESGFFAQLDSSKGIIPFPNNLLFSGTTDGTLEIPIPDLDTECPNGGEILLKTALNDLDGFSTTAPITAPFTSAIDTSTLAVGSNVRVFEVSLGGSGEVTGIIGELDATEVSLGVSSVDNEISGATNATTGELCDSEDIGANKLVISPLKPLKPKTNYLVALTNDIDGPYGLKAAASTTYAFAKSTNPLLSAFPPTSLADANYSALTSTVDLDGDDVVDVDVNEDGVIDAADTVAVLTSLGQLEGLRQLTNASEAWVEAYTVTIDNAGANTITDLLVTDIVMSWTFTTQSAGDVLADVRATVEGGAIPTAAVVDSGTDSPLTAADIYVG